MEFRELNHEKVLSFLPDRDPVANKGVFGKLLLLCGSVGYTGAAALSAMGALRSGAGLVYLGVPKSIYEIEAVKLTEPVVFPLPEDNGRLCSAAFGEINAYLTKCDAVLLGPGIGRSDNTEKLICKVLKAYSGPVILDADGINLMRSHKDILRGRTGVTILTPHEGEFRSFGGVLGTDRPQAAARLAIDTDCIVVLKGHETVITDGVVCYINRTGNPGMAVGGSGDVLAGIVTALVGQGIAPLEAAACAVWLHGSAGDLCAQALGQYGMLPSDMLNILPRLMK